MLMFDTDHLALHASRLRCVADGAKCLLGMFLHLFLVLYRRILKHLRVRRELMNHQHDGFGADPLS
jgi:hypothetical protein